MGLVISQRHVVNVQIGLGLFVCDNVYSTMVMFLFKYLSGNWPNFTRISPILFSTRRTKVNNNYCHYSNNVTDSLMKVVKQAVFWSIAKLASPGYVLACYVTGTLILDRAQPLCLLTWCQEPICHWKRRFDSYSLSERKCVQMQALWNSWSNMKICWNNNQNQQQVTAFYDIYKAEFFNFSLVIWQLFPFLAFLTLWYCYWLIAGRILWLLGNIKFAFNNFVCKR